MLGSANMARRPTREWLDALATTAILSGCASAPPAAPPASPPPATSASSIPANASSTTASASSAPASASSAAEPATEAGPAPVVTAEPARAKGVALPPFDPSSCQGPIPARAEPSCVDEKLDDDAEVAKGRGQNLANIRAACQLDALVVFQVKAETQQQGVTVPSQAIETGRTGDPCASAADKKSCEERVNSVNFPDKAGFLEPSGNRTFLVVTQGDNWSLISNREQLVGLIGPVDSKQDAAALLWLDGWGGYCSKLRVQGTSFVMPSDKLGMRCPGFSRGHASVRIPSVPEGYDKEGNYRLQVDRQGALKVTYLGGAPKREGGFGPVCGRRPSGMLLGSELEQSACDDHESGEAEVGAYLAECARLEAAAVMAFELMASELSAHGAPASFIERCSLAAEDERRHTQAMTEAARRYGVEPTLPGPLTRNLPSLLELARENTIEGCVRETWGALSAVLQARTAQDPALAALYASIAPDELAHAELSWDIHAWLAEQTGASHHLGELAEVARAELLAEQDDAHSSVARLAGAPDRATACRLIRELAA